MAEWEKNKNRNEKIRELRRNGYSIPSIATQLQCSKSTVSLHCRGIQLTKSQKIVLKRNEDINRRNLWKGNKSASKIWENKRNAAKQIARVEWMAAKNDPITMAFLGLYLGEGSKAHKGKTGVVGMTNNDPFVIKFFYEFIINKITNAPQAEIRCYKSHNKDECKKFWQNLLPKARIRICDVYDKRVKDLNQPHERCKHGACSLRIGDYKLWHKIMTWLECWKSENV